MKLNRKGFTLVELLVTIVIIALVLGLTTFGILSVVDDSKKESTIISKSNLKESARIYSSEKDSLSWKKNDDFDAFCVTVGELKNKGLIDKDSTIEDNNINNDTYIILKRNKVSYVIENEEIVTTDDDNYKICTGTIINSEEEITNPKVGSTTIYTDRLEISFTPGKSTYKGSNTTGDYKCLYGDSTSNINKEGKIEGNTCIIEDLYNDSSKTDTYYAYIYMNTTMGSTVKADGQYIFNTKEFSKTEYAQDTNKVTIKYNDSNVRVASYYFTSTVEATSSKDVYKCILSKNNIFTCSDTKVKELEKNVWYKTLDKDITLTYKEENNTLDISSRIYDETNNYRQDTNNFIIKKHIVKFYKNKASLVDGLDSEYVERYCIAAGTNTCNITSPSITAPTGHYVVGWNTDKNALASTWNMGAVKAVNTSTSYYAIIDKYKVHINYNITGGTFGTSTGGYNWTKDSNGIISRNGSLLEHTIKYGEKLNSSGLQNYNNGSSLNIVKTGYSAPSGSEWICQSGCYTSNKTYSQETVYSYFNESNNPTFCDASKGDCTVVLGVNWKPITYTITYNLGGGSVSGNPTSYNIETDSFTLKNPTRTGYTFTGWTGSNGNTPQTSVTISKGSTGDKSYTANWTPNKVIIQYSINGGTITASNSGGKWTTNNDIIYLNGNILTTTINYGETINSSGLNNWNNSNYINVTKKYYTAVTGAEWKCISGCSNNSSTYNHATTTYKSSDFCDVGAGDCSVTVGVNWTLSSIESSIKAWKSTEGTDVTSGVAANSWISFRFYGYPSDMIERIEYCVDTTNTCTPNKTYAGDDHIERNSYIRYRAVSKTGIVESTNSFHGLIANIQ